MKNLLILTILILFTQCEPIPTQSVSVNKRLIFNDHNYEALVGMVQLLPVENSSPSILENPVVSLNEPQQLLLQFDLLTDKFEYLAAKIYHCNKDWTHSVLRDMEFLNSINNFRITEFDYSLNTTQPYINYRILLPKPFQSGNYIVTVHRRGNPSDILFSRKFLVVNNISSINHEVRVSTTVSKRDLNHQIEFSVNYGNIQVGSPTQDISVVILKNHNWMDAITELQPTLIRPNENFMEFRSLNLENNFPGGNEFRFFDLRTLSVTGRNVSQITPKGDRIHARLGLDRSRGKEVYTQNLRDINGNFILQNTDPGEVPLNADYANVQFQLKAEQVPGNVYVAGRFNNWKLGDENIMSYNSDQGLYQTTLYLKQGYYDYKYVVEASNNSAYIFEGSHFQAENDYEILVYYKKPGNVNDELIGYKKFSSLPL